MTLLHQTLTLMPMETLFEWTNKQANGAKSALVTVFGLVLIAGCVVRIVKSGFSLGAIVFAFVVAGLAGWLVMGDGISTVSTLFGNQGK